jgi:hypothetical protein
MVAPLEIYEDVAEVLANMDPVKVGQLKASAAQQARLELLLEKNRSQEGLSEAESVELDRILMLNRVISLAKIRAKRLLTDETKN